MTHLIHIDIPGLAQNDLMQCVDAGHTEALRSIIESGEAGIIPASRFFPAGELSIMTGMSAEMHAISHHDQVRADGFGIEPLTKNKNSPPAYWDTLDNMGISCCVINWCATRHARLENGIVIADTALKVLSKNDAVWGIPPGSVSPHDSLDLVGNLRLHPEYLTKEQISVFNEPLNTKFTEEKKAHLAARMLSELVSAHSIATHFITENSQQVVTVRYPTLLEVNHFFSPIDPENMGNAAGQAVILIDQFIDRILSLTSEDTHILITGGGDKNGSGFVIRKGPGIEADSLGSHSQRYEDLYDLILGYFPATDNTDGKRPLNAKSNFFESEEKWIDQLRQLGFIKTKPTAPQDKMKAHCNQQNGLA